MLSFWTIDLILLHFNKLTSQWKKGTSSTRNCSACLQTCQGFCPWTVCKRCGGARFAAAVEFVLWSRWSPCPLPHSLLCLLLFHHTAQQSHLLCLSSSPVRGRSLCVPCMSQRSVALCFSHGSPQVITSFSSTAVRVTSQQQANNPNCSLDLPLCLILTTRN